MTESSKEWSIKLRGDSRGYLQPPMNWQRCFDIPHHTLWDACCYLHRVMPDIKTKQVGEMYQRSQGYSGSQRMYLHGAGFTTHFQEILEILTSNFSHKGSEPNVFHSAPITDVVVLALRCGWSIPDELKALASPPAPEVPEVAATPPTEVQAPAKNNKPVPVVMALVEPDKNAPRPLTTNEIANCFAGLRDWDLARWKRELSSPEGWLKVCQHSKGTRGKGGHQSTWLPVLIASALISQDHRSARSLYSRFKKSEPLKPWLDAFESNHLNDAESQ